MTILGSADVAPRASRAVALCLLAVVGLSTTSPTQARATPVAHPEAAPLGELRAACHGVIVVVDTGEPATSSTRCVDEVAGTGLDALANAGHRFAFVPGIAGMVCVIDDLPNPCNRAPTTAYWSYWLASDDTWTYSQLGAGFRTAQVGVLEGWRFGDGSQPPRASPLTVAPSTVGTSAETAGASAVPLAIGTALVGVVILGGLSARRRRRRP